MARSQHLCTSCGKSFPTLAGLRRHIGQRPQCQRHWNAIMMEQLNERSILSDDEDDGLTSMIHDFEDERAGTPMVPDNLRNWQPPHSPSLPARSPPPASTCQSKRSENDANRTYGRFFEPFEGSGAAFRMESNTFEDYHRQREESKTEKYAPFMDEEEWDLAAWMMKHLGQNRIDEFLKMPIVCGHLI